MTTPRISKLEARKRAHEASRRANEARAAKKKANIDDAAEILVAVGKIAEVETWKKERLAQLRRQLDVEVAKKVDAQRARGGAAVVRMQGRGETLTTIAARTDLGIGIVRTMLRHGPKPEKPTASDDSHALGAGGVTGGPMGVVDPYSSEPPADAASARMRRALRRGEAKSSVRGMSGPGGVGRPVRALSCPCAASRAGDGGTQAGSASCGEKRSTGTPARRLPAVLRCSVWRRLQDHTGPWECDSQRPVGARRAERSECQC